jgi:hypothetical protein
MAVQEVKHGPRGGKSANLSPLMAALNSATDGEVVNACPFGCETEDLSDKGHCRHLIGFTLPQDAGRFEVLEPPDENGSRRVNGRKIEKVRPGDKLMRVTICHRVYRKSPDDAKPE